MDTDALRALVEDPERSWEAANRVKQAGDFHLPHLDAWNYGPCRQHRRWEDEDGNTREGQPKPGCRQCGINFRRHQRIGIPWLYLRGRALLADTVGSGKTVHAAGLIALMQQTGELIDYGKVVIVCRAPAVLQWQDELNRTLPMLNHQVAMGTKRKRTERYLQPWDTMLIGQQMLLNDLEKLLEFRIAALIVDDVDALRNRDNKTAYSIKRLGRHARRMVIMTGTPLQKRLHELHSVLEPIGGAEIFGPQASFMRRYVRVEPQTFWTPKGRKTTVNKVVGYKNMDEFKRLIDPLVLRRTAADIDDVDLPVVNPVNIRLELHPRQREKYEELKRGVVQVVKESGVELRQADALRAIHLGAQICGGLATLGEDDGEGASVKLDWLMDKLQGDLDGEKVVVFCAYKNTVRALQARLAAADIGHVTIWGEEADKTIRKQRQDQFWQDPNIRVLIGTQAIEQSLNLQCSRHLVNVDMILNPARMEQLAGRIRRDGSAFPHVWVHNLLTEETQEERYLPLLEKEQALIDHVWDDNSELFESLSPLAMMQLITG